MRRRFSILAGAPKAETPTHVAETTDLVVRAALGVKVGSTLSSTHVQASQSVLEDLLEAEELENGQVDGRVQTKSTLVRSEDRRELNAVSAVNVAVALCAKD